MPRREEVDEVLKKWRRAIERIETEQRAAKKVSRELKG